MRERLGRQGGERERLAGERLDRLGRGRRVRDEHERPDDRRLREEVGERVSARPVDEVDVVDHQDDQRLAGSLGRSLERPPERLGERPPAFAGRSSGHVAGVPQEELEPPARVGAGGAPVARLRLVARGRPRARTASRTAVSAIFAHDASGADRHDHVAARRASREELDDEARLAAARVADDVGRREHRLRVVPPGLEPLERVRTCEERQHVGPAADGVGAVHRRRLRRSRPRRCAARLGAARGERPAGAACVAMGTPQSPQNFCPTGVSAPHARQRIAVVGEGRDVRPSTETSASSSAAARSRALWKRSSRGLASARSVSSAKGAGMPRSGATLRGSGGGSLRCRSSVLVAESPMNGTRPVRSSKSTTPSE